MLLVEKGYLLDNVGVFGPLSSERHDPSVLSPQGSIVMSRYTIRPDNDLLASLHMKGPELQDLLGRMKRLGVVHAHIWEDDVYCFSLEEDEAGVWHIFCRPEFQRHRELQEVSNRARLWSRMFRRN